MDEPNKNIDVKTVEWFDQHWYRVELSEDTWKQFLKDRKDGQYKNVRTDDKFSGALWLPSVTTKLFASPKPYLAQWRGEVGNDEANERFWAAGEKGTRIHSATQIYDEGGAVIYQPWGRPSYSDEEIKSISEQHGGKICILHDQDELYQVYKWRRFIEETGAVMLQTEMIVYDIGMNCAGTVDRIAGVMAGEYAVNGSKPLKIEESGKYLIDIKSSKSIDDDYYLQVAAYQNMYEKMTGEEINGRIIVHTNAQTKKGIEGLSCHLRLNDTIEDDYNAFMHIAATWERKFIGMKPRVFDMPPILSTVLEGKECQEKQ